VLVAQSDLQKQQEALAGKKTARIRQMEKKYRDEEKEECTALETFKTETSAAIEQQTKETNLRIASIEAAQNKDSVGGIVRCAVTGVPAGWGEPVFDKLDARLAYAMMGLGAVKGIEFGIGFKAAKLSGSENHDPMREDFEFATNNAGGILGGISTGDEIYFDLAVKPTPSIAQEQETVNKAGESTQIKITGRHAPCIVSRIIPVVEAMTAIVLADFALLQRCAKVQE
jgi:chorismate synthase